MLSVEPSPLLMVVMALPSTFGVPFAVFDTSGAPLISAAAFSLPELSNPAPAAASDERKERRPNFQFICDSFVLLCTLCCGQAMTFLSPVVFWSEDVFQSQLQFTVVYSG